MFVVGDEQRQLRVHSLFLRTVSPVFNALLGPRYSEGASLSSEHPPAIPLPEDNPKAMETIFSIIHFRNDAVEERFELDDVLQLAIAIDKYDMRNALRLSIRDWLQHSGTRDPKKLWQLVKASYLFRNSKTFEAATLGHLCHFNGCYSTLDGADAIFLDAASRFACTCLFYCRAALVNSLLGMMEQRRSRLRLEVVCLATQGGSELPPNKYRKFPGNKQDASHISKTSLSDTMQSLFLPLPPPSFPEGYRGSGIRTYPEASVESSLVRELLKDLTSKGLGGLCLTCVRTGEDHQIHGN